MLGRGGLDFTQSGRLLPPSDGVNSGTSTKDEIVIGRDHCQETSLGSRGPFTPRLLEEMGVLAPVKLSAEALNLLATMRNTHPPASMTEQQLQLDPALMTSAPAVPMSDSRAAAQDELLAPSVTREAQPILLPRETGADIGMASPVPLTQEAISVISKLRNKKDEAEDWGRWRDVLFRAKAALALGPSKSSAIADAKRPEFQPAVHIEADGSTSLYCPECFVPLHPDPHPSKLYIFLHAKRYSAAEWCFETEMPEWAQAGYEWD